MYDGPRCCSGPCVLHRFIVLQGLRCLGTRATVRTSTPRYPMNSHRQFFDLVLQPYALLLTFTLPNGSYCGLLHASPRKAFGLWSVIGRSPQAAPLHTQAVLHSPIPHRSPPQPPTNLRRIRGRGTREARRRGKVWQRQQMPTASVPVLFAVVPVKNHRTRAGNKEGRLMGPLSGEGTQQLQKNVTFSRCMYRGVHCVVGIRTRQTGSGQLEPSHRCVAPCGRRCRTS